MANPARIATTFYFIRHGRTEMNRLGLLQGRGGHGLLPEGLRDAETAAADLTGKGVGAIVSSDQQRARETSELIHSRLALKESIRFTEELREMDYGEMSGRPEPEVLQLCPLFRKDATFVFPGGESFAGVQTRALAWLQGATRRFRGETLAVVTHGGVLRTLFAALRGVELDRCLMGTVGHGVMGRLELADGEPQKLELSPGVTIFPPS
jgi:2,3-bisphosphoglycerate-dependent phosphoglycerate mutase